VLVLAVGLGVPCASAAAAELPTVPTGAVQVGVTSGGWTVEDRGPAKVEDVRTTQVVVRRPDGAVDALLYPEAQVPDLCDPRSTEFHCLPLRTIFGPGLRMGRKGLLVTDQNADGIPEVAISMFSLGAHCCVTTVGYWRAADGTWASDITNGGSAGGARSDRSGRVEVADPGFEGMSWAYAETQAFTTWSRLIPGTGWVDATRPAEHRAEISRMSRLVRRFSRIDGADQAVQAARAVRIGHRKALRQSSRVAAERAIYRRVYGRADLKTLDGVLRTVAEVR
jgi:hypothetical protein